jgi:hypothetical protein
MLRPSQPNGSKAMGQPHNLTQVIINWLPILLLAGVFVFFLLRNRTGDRTPVRSQAKAGTGRARTIVTVAMYALVLAFYWFLAFRFPWAWDFDHIGVALICVLLSVQPIIYGYVWWFRGYPALKEQWALAAEISSRSKLSWKGMLFWMATGVALVFVVNWLQQRGH